MLSHTETTGMSPSQALPGNEAAEAHVDGQNILAGVLTLLPGEWAVFATGRLFQIMLKCHPLE